MTISYGNEVHVQQWYVYTESLESLRNILNARSKTYKNKFLMVLSPNGQKSIINANSILRVELVEEKSG